MSCRLDPASAMIGTLPSVPARPPAPLGLRHPGPPSRGGCGNRGRDHPDSRVGAQVGQPAGGGGGGYVADHEGHVLNVRGRLDGPLHDVGSAWATIQQEAVTSSASRASARSSSRRVAPWRRPPGAGPALLRGVRLLLVELQSAW